MFLFTTSNISLATSNQLDQVNSGEMSRLINAALVDCQFCDLLLNRPDQALTQGYHGESFTLSPRDRHFILTAKATSLPNLAQSWLDFNRRR